MMGHIIIRRRINVKSIMKNNHVVEKQIKEESMRVQQWENLS
jgi:hypothetical protein